MGLSVEFNNLLKNVRDADESGKPAAEKTLQDFLDKKEAEGQANAEERETLNKKIVETSETNKKLVEDLKKELEETKNNLAESKKQLETKETIKIEAKGLLL